MKPPAFWQTDGILPRLLSPFGAVTARATANRVARPGWRAPIPVICVGNATMGGAGKTTVVLDLAARLTALGRRPHLLTRGYGGRIRSSRAVRPDDTGDLVGDEPLLLVQAAPTWVGPDRATSARLAVEAGADILIMDDGLQNPTLHKDLSFLVIDGESGFGNGHVFPAGPLREPVEAAAARCQAVILIGPDRTNVAAALSLPILRAHLIPGPEITTLAGTHVLALAGIARPEKFFAMLEQAGIIVAHRAPMPDHHRFSETELAALTTKAKQQGLTPVTTAKDAARLPASYHGAFRVVTVSLAWDNEPALTKLLSATPIATAP